MDFIYIGGILIVFIIGFYLGDYLSKIEDKRINNNHNNGLMFRLRKSQKDQLLSDNARKEAEIKFHSLRIANERKSKAFRNSIKMNKELLHTVRYIHFSYPAIVENSLKARGLDLDLKENTIKVIKNKIYNE